MPLLTITGFIDFEPFTARYERKKNIAGFPYAEMGDIAGFWIKPSQMDSLTETDIEVMQAKLESSVWKWLNETS